MFDRTKLKLKSLRERIHDIDINSIQSLEETKFYNKSIPEVAKKIIAARKNRKEVILMMGGHFYWT